MVHPYLRRRQGLEVVEYPNEQVRAILGKTLGVPLFQEQAMKLAMVAAGFSPDQADQLRRAIASKRSKQRLEQLGQQLVAGMLARGYSGEFARRCLQQFHGFAEYGFPESHAASFALWFTRRRGSSTTTGPRSPRRCSTASQWASTHPPRSSPTPSAMACAPWAWMSI